MKKLRLILLLICMLLVCAFMSACSDDTNNADTENDAAAKNTSKLEETEEPEAETGWTELVYDKDGDLCFTNEYRPDGQLSLSVEHRYECDVFTEYTYDDDGNLLEMMETENNSVRSYKKYAYDDRGLLVYYETKWDELFKYTYTYDEAGRLVFEEAREYEYHEYNYEYDSDGKHVMKYELNVDGDNGEQMTVLRNEKFYDDNGNLLKNIDYVGGEVYGTDEYSYDESGNLLKHTDYDGNGAASLIEEYEYDNNGNKVKESVYDNGVDLISYIEYEYNAEGYLVCETSHSRLTSEDGPDVYGKNYEYDANGHRIVTREF